jgi:methylase of polypeptide subunit release factors
MTPLPLHAALVHIGTWLRYSHYEFITVTPATHARINSRAGTSKARTLREVFGWSRPFESTLLPADAFNAMQAGNLLETQAGLFRSKVRFSSLGRMLFAHSAYPTQGADAVFFGPDTYRFASLIENALHRHPLNKHARILDVGCGAGPGGLVAARHAGMPVDAAVELVLADINPQALVYARANAELNGMAGAQCRQGDLFAAADGQFDLIVANPPYLVDPAGRLYRNGGGNLGTGLGERIVTEGIARLRPGGQLLLYTGVPIIEGRDPFLAAIAPALQRAGSRFDYRELDPDVFGEELDMPAYAAADRIAAVALTVHQDGKARP